MPRAYDWNCEIWNQNKDISEHRSLCSTSVGKKYTKVVQILKNGESVEWIPSTSYDKRATIFFIYGRDQLISA